jgi:ATP-dependent DNA ligase
VRTKIDDRLRLPGTCGPDGVAVFDALHRRHKANDVILHAFDLLELDGDDLRPRLLGERKARLANRLMLRRYGVSFWLA